DERRVAGRAGLCEVPRAAVKAGLDLDERAAVVDAARDHADDAAAADDRGSAAPGALDADRDLAEVPAQQRELAVGWRACSDDAQRLVELGLELRAVRDR